MKNLILILAITMFSFKALCQETISSDVFASQGNVLTSEDSVNITTYTTKPTESLDSNVTETEVISYDNVYVTYDYINPWSNPWNLGLNFIGMVLDLWWLRFWLE